MVGNTAAFFLSTLFNKVLRPLVLRSCLRYAALCHAHANRCACSLCNNVSAAQALTAGGACGAACIDKARLTLYTQGSSSHMAAMAAAAAGVSC
jgi:hypothetical protein